MSSSPSIVKCENCGADMLYSPTTQGLSCPYCDSKKDIPKIPTSKRNFFTECGNSVIDDSTSTYKCPNCGGEVVFDSYITSTKCPFCSATNIVKLADVPGLKPDGILPFLYTKEMAYEAGKAWIKRKFFALKEFKKNFKAENFNGVYVPSYLYTSDTYTTYNCRLGEYYYVTVRGSDGKSRRERRTRWFTVSGTLSKFFNDVAVEATRQITQKEFEKIDPYDTGNLEGYQREYLAGFSSEKCDATLDVCFETAKGIMAEGIRRDILSRYKYDVVGEYNATTSYPTVTFNYALLPVWIFGCKHKDKIYRYVVNGRTGQSYGKYPKSPSRIALVVLSALATVAGIVCIVLALNGYFS